MYWATLVSRRAKLLGGISEAQQHNTKTPSRRRALPVTTRDRRCKERPLLPIASP